MRICLVPRVSGVGGMVSFQQKIATGLLTRGLQVSYDLEDTPYQAILVIGGTRQLAGLWRAKRNNIPIIQRLDGMNWIHRLHRSRTNLRLYLRSEYGNWLLALIRKRLANRIAYQSEFVRVWWEREHGTTPVPTVVIHNAVDLQIYSPQGAGSPPENHCRLLLVEGSLSGGYELGVEFAINVARQMACLGLPFVSNQIELVIVGKVGAENKKHWDTEMQCQTGESSIRLTWHGVAQGAQIPEIDRSAHLLYAADINSACPNSVIEAMACGLPVVAFDTGALSELVTPDAGRLIPYGGDPWKLETPDFEGLADAAAGIIQERERFSHGARRRAEQAFDLQRMLDAYLAVLLEG